MVKPECKGIEEQLQDTKNDLIVAQEDYLLTARNSTAQQLARKEVVRLLDLVRDLERSFRDCEGLPQFPQPIRAVLTSTVIVSTSTGVFSPTFPSGVQITMSFSDINYRLVEFSFPLTVVGTSVGGVPPVTITNSISAKTPSPVTGAFDLLTGHIDMTTARFDVTQSLAFTDNGTVDFMPLTTRTVASPSAPGGVLTGMPLDRSITPGRVVLVGSSVFQGGLFFGGNSVDLIIDGVLSAFPPA